MGVFVLTGFAVFLKQRATQDSRVPAQNPPEVSQPQPGSSNAPLPKADDSLVKNIFDGTFSKEVGKSSQPVLVDFWATWCGPCRMFGPIVDQLAKDYKGRLKVCRVDVDQNPRLSQTFQVRAIPTAILFKNGKVMQMWVGLVSEEELKTGVNKVLKRPQKQKPAES